MSLRSRFRATVSAVIADVKRPPWVPAGHYYSARPSASDVQRALVTTRAPAGIDLRADDQVRLAGELNLSMPPERRWTATGQSMFMEGDAAILRAMLIRFKPARLMEIGSGLSTAMALDVSDDNLPTLHITCIEPHPERLRSRLRPGDEKHLALIERQVQALSPEELVSGLEPGDFFFIDSTHVVKAGSDVVWLFLHTLPLLPPGVIVHVHDIFWPFEYLDDWLREGREWTEIYLLQAFLMYNSDWEILLFGSWLWHEHPELVPADLAASKPGSIWLRRR